MLEWVVAIPLTMYSLLENTEAKHWGHAKWEARRYLRYLLTIGIDPKLSQSISTGVNARGPPTLEEVGDVIIPFGKYARSPLKDVVTNRGGMHYLLYISDWDKCDSALRDAILVIHREYERQKQHKLFDLVLVCQASNIRLE
jgi:hypothetical protein